MNAKTQLNNPVINTKISKTKRVAIIAYPKLCLFEFSCAVELFALPRPDIQNWYQTDIISINETSHKATGNIQVSSNIIFNAKHGFDNYDMVVIAGWSGLDANVSKDLREALRRFHHKGGTLVSFCSGAFALAATGLLDNKQATTHWRYEEAFKSAFPTINFQENVLYTTEDRLFTSAGSAAALDLGIILIRNDFGTRIANDIAKRLVISPQRAGGQTQYANNNILKESHQLSPSIEWAINNLQETFTIKQMAEKSSLSRRSFDRNFRNRHGMSPKEWLTRQRVSLARELLETTQESIDRIAERSGFGSSMNLRHHFKKVLSISPSHYRQQFLLD